MDGQTIFAVIVGFALAVFSLVMVGYAFFRGNADDAEDYASVEYPGDDSVGLDSICDSIDTLELEYQLGNVPEEQYRQQLQSYRMQAAFAVKAILEWGDAPPELALEREVMTARSRMNGRDSDDPRAAGKEEEDSALADEREERPWAGCPQCDAAPPIADTPCPQCGATASADSSLLRGEG